MAQTRAVLSAWRQDYNTDRPHSKLGGRTPAEIAGQRGWGACPQPRCHHLNHPPSTQRTLRLSRYDQGSTSLTAAQVSDQQPAPELLLALPPADILLAHPGYDSDRLRMLLIERGTLPVIPNNPTRKRFHPFDQLAYQQRTLIKRVFCRLNDWRRIATRYDKLAANFASAVAIAFIIVWWT